MKAMTDKTDGFGDLDAFFDAARGGAPEVSDDFIARLTADALAEMPVAGARVVSRPGLFGQLKASLGGWAGFSGLAAACAVGIWVGVNPPATLTDGLGLEDLWGTSASLGEMGVDPLSGFELALLEG